MVVAVTEETRRSRQRGAQGVESTVPGLAVVRTQGLLPEFGDGVRLEEVQLARQLVHVERQTKGRARGIDCLRRQGVHLDEFVHDLPAPTQAVLWVAALPLRRQGEVAVVLQAHQPGFRLHAVDLRHTDAAGAQMPPDGQKIQRFVRRPRVAVHHHAGGRVAGGGRRPAQPVVAARRGIGGQRREGRILGSAGQQGGQEGVQPFKRQGRIASGHTRRSSCRDCPLGARAPGPRMQRRRTVPAPTVA